MFEFIGGTLFGIFLLVGYGAYRAVNSDGWDDSNIMNWLRLLSHVFMHPEDFGHMYYIDDSVYDELCRRGYDMESNRPFSYIIKDEFSENFPESRP